jgi:murein DD-endopeptidase MepM/ murein hydrolase activator NlpD
MTEDKWTLLFLKDEREGFRQYSISTRTLRYAAGGAAFFCLAVVIAASLVIFRAGDTVRAVQLERTNTLLAAELASLRDRVGSLQETIDTLSERDAQLRVLAGLDPIDEEVRQVGVGGPGAPSLESHPLYALDEEAGTTAFTTTYDLNALERRARLLKESLDVAADSLQAHRDLLESTPSILPTSGMLTSGFTSARPHPIHHRELPHEGIDISAPRGTPILAAAKGRVSFAGRRSGYGLTVELDHGYGYSTIYGHASQLLVRQGQEVKRGDVIARVGSTGLATSPHLHYEVRIGGRPVNPMNYVITGAIP